MDKLCKPKCNKKNLGLFAVLAILFCIMLTILVYINDYYHALPDADRWESLTGVEIHDEQGLFAAVPKNPKAGIIFYPGGKVDYRAYIPLMVELSKQDYLCVLTEMPGNLAMFDVDRAEGLRRDYPQVSRWYMAGHSLGGAAAAMYLSDCPEEYKGLILLGAYSTKDLSDTSLQVLSIYGSEDLVLNREAYAENLVNLPKNFSEVIIEGGCHAYFGMYGPQDGDGTPSISNEEQIEQTVEAVCDFIE